MLLARLHVNRPLFSSAKRLCLSVWSSVVMTTSKQTLNANATERIFIIEFHMLVFSIKNLDETTATVFNVEQLLLP